VRLTEVDKYFNSSLDHEQFIHFSSGKAKRQEKECRSCAWLQEVFTPFRQRRTSERAFSGAGRLLTDLLITLDLDHVDKLLFRSHYRQARDKHSHDIHHTLVD